MLSVSIQVRGIHEAVRRIGKEIEQRDAAIRRRTVRRLIPRRSAACAAVR